MFSDADLKRLKEHIADEDYMRVTCDSDALSALINRLEAAEVLAETMATASVMTERLMAQIEAWRKSAGK